MAVLALVTVAVVATGLAAGDLARRRLPNPGVAAFAVAVAALLVSGRSTGGLGPVAALIVGAVAAGLGVAVWSAGLMGAGDAKVLGPLVALEAWMGSGPALVWLGCTIVGLVAGLAWLLTRRAALVHPASVPRPLAGAAAEPGPAAPGDLRPSVPLGTILLAGVAPSALALAVWG